MFRTGRWRNEKNRIKVVFRLKFHATQASELNTEGLILSLVPGDVGKPTARSEKAVVRDGQCRWEIPVYETVKFLKDAKTGKVNQRIYHLIVSTTGSTRGGLVGETSIDFADYADAIKTCNVCLPLHNTTSKALLHVSIQRQLEFDDPQREEDECNNLEKMSHGKDLKSHLSLGDADEPRASGSHEEGPFGKAARFAELRRRASTESDSTMSSSGSVIEPTTPEEVAKSLRHPPKQLHSSKALFEEPRVSESEWSGSSDRGITTDDSTNDKMSKNSSEDGDEIEKLKNEVACLTRQADLSDLELQSLRKQVVKETKRSQDLLKEVNSLKQERDSLKEDCERHKVADKTKTRNRLQFEGRDPWILLEETREELDYEKDRNFNLRLQLQKTQESNSELILAVQDLEAMLEERSKEAPRTIDTDEDEDQKALEELVKGHMDGNNTHVLEQKITELYNEIEVYKRDKEELEIQMEQLALDYEILKQENHDVSYKLEQSQLQDQLKMQYECSSELENQLEAQMEILEEEMERQAEVFEADIDAVTRGKVEQEQRAIQAEEDLRKTRRRNASVAEKLQEEFKRLSEQMDSMFASSEKMAMKAMTEANELRMQKREVEEMLKKANDEYEAKLKELSEKLSQMERHEEEVTSNLNQEIKFLKDEIENLQKDKHSLMLQEESLRGELEETERNKNELESRIESMREESESLAEELQAVKRIKDEKEAAITHLQTELETVRAKFDDLNHLFSENDSEMEKHKKQVTQVKGEMKKKEEAIANLEKKLKESRIAFNNLTKTAQRNNNKGSTVGAKEVAVMKDKIKLLEGQIKLKETALEASSNMFIEKEKNLKNRIEELETSLDQNSLEVINKDNHEKEEVRVLEAEMALLRECNETMEMELKEMQERYSELSLRFAEVEGERQQLVMTVRNLKNAKRS
ncbi:BnaCnng14760D [Brassica napus]|uniref:BnaCnng14760D protein n=1 Tax=Brassica napus TaxID=3708 RepID=A0A078ID94_BRANA|nr:BnaCnng14760D [Brassica napus]